MDSSALAVSSDTKRVIALSFVSFSRRRLGQLRYAGSHLAITVREADAIELSAVHGVRTGIVLNIAGTLCRSLLSREGVAVATEGTVAIAGLNHLRGGDPADGAVAGSPVAPISCVVPGPGIGPGIVRTRRIPLRTRLIVTISIVSAIVVVGVLTVAVSAIATVLVTAILVAAILVLITAVLVLVTSVLVTAALVLVAAVLVTATLVLVTSVLVTSALVLVAAVLVTATLVLVTAVLVTAALVLVTSVLVTAVLVLVTSILVTAVLVTTAIVVVVAAAAAAVAAYGETNAVILSTTLGDRHKDRLVVGSRGHGAKTVVASRKTTLDIGSQKTLTISGGVDTLKEDKLGGIKGVGRVGVTASVLDSDVSVTNDVTAAIKILRCSVVGVRGVGEGTRGEVVHADLNGEVGVRINVGSVERVGDNASNHVASSGDAAHSCHILSRRSLLYSKIGVDLRIPLQEPPSFCSPLVVSEPVQKLMKLLASLSVVSLA